MRVTLENHTAQVKPITPALVLAIVVCFTIVLAGRSSSAQDSRGLPEGLQVAGTPTDIDRTVEDYLPEAEGIDGNWVIFDEGERTRGEVSSTLGDQGEEHLMNWRWRENVYRDFNRLDAESHMNDVSFLSISVHRFANSEGAASALLGFADSVISAQGLTNIEVPTFGDETLALEGSGDGVNLAILYIRDSNIVIRIGASSIEGDPLTFLLAFAPEWIDKSPVAMVQQIDQWAITHSIEGSGPAFLDGVDLKSGQLSVHGTSDETGRFIVVLLDPGNESEILFDEASPFEGNKTIASVSEGQYSLSVEATGAWSVTLEQQTIATATPTPIETPTGREYEATIAVLQTQLAGVGTPVPSNSINASTPVFADGATITSKDIFFEPDEFTISADTDVRISLPNEGAAPHNFSIDELDIDIDQAPGATEQAVISAPVGEYEYYCNVPGHREAGMVGTLTVE